MSYVTTHRLCLVTICCLAAAAHRPAEAAVQQFYTDRAAFLAAAAGNPTASEDFNTAQLGLIPAVGLPLPAFSVVPLYANTNQLWVDSGAGSLDVDGTNYLYADVRPASATIFQFELQFAQPVSGFGADFFNAYSSAGVALRDQNNNLLADFAVNWNPIGTGFFGFTLTEPITKLRFREGSGTFGVVETFGMDNVVLAVPEPSTLLLLGAIATIRRHRRF